MRGLLRSVWREPAPVGVPGPGRRDGVLVGVLAVVVAVEGALRPGLMDRGLQTGVALALLPTLLWRRTRPLRVVLIAFVATALARLAMGSPDPQLYSLVYLLMLPYALCRWGSGREVVLGSSVIAGNLGLALLTGRTSLADTVGAVVVLGMTFAVGVAVRYRAQARTRELDQVVLLERERLARDLHDIVAHHVSAIAIRAQAGLAVAAVRPDAAMDALRVVEGEATAALTELRAMVRVLRHDEPAEFGPQPRIGDLQRLAGSTVPGPLVEVELAGDLSGLPAAVEAAVFRLVQESLTNARRHARRPTRIVVSVTADADTVRLRVDDDGDPPGAVNEDGYGLRGMRERVALLGGTVEAGPAAGRGWSVSAVLPRGGLRA